MILSLAVPPISALAGGLLDAPPGGGAGAEGPVNPSRRLSWRRAICPSFSSREAASQGSELQRRGAGTEGGKHDAAAKSMRPIKPRWRLVLEARSVRSGSRQSSYTTISSQGPIRADEESGMVRGVSA